MPKIELTCDFCGTSFIAHEYSKRKYCSLTCNYAAKKPPVVKCEYCGNDFIGKDMKLTPEIENVVR